MSVIILVIKNGDKNYTTIKNHIICFRIKKTDIIVNDNYCIYNDFSMSNNIYLKFNSLTSLLVLIIALSMV